MSASTSKCLNSASMLISMASFLTSFFISSVASEDFRFRVMRGIDDTEDKYPYVVVIAVTKHSSTNRTFTRGCTASIITPNWVLTAAHCLKQPEVKEKRVIYGDLTIPPSETEYYRRVIREYPHPGYRNIKILRESNANLLYHSSFRNDIGLILVERLVLSGMGKVSAVNFESLVGLPVKYVGTGKTSYDVLREDQIRPRQIGEAVVVKCNKQGYYYFDKSTQVKIMTDAALICLRPKCKNTKQRSNAGDSGGPLMLGGKIVGVLSGRIDQFMIYSAVSPYLEWIGHVIATEKIT